LLENIQGKFFQSWFFGLELSIASPVKQLRHWSKYPTPDG